MRTCQLSVPTGLPDDALKAYLRFYQLETWIREMVYLELKACYGEQWWQAVEDALRRSRISVNLPTRYAARDKKHPHISTSENDPLWFLSLDSLVRIVLDVKLWKFFGSYFTTKKLFRMRLEEVLPIRNRVAHYRNLHHYDLDRLNQFLRDFDPGLWRFCTSYGDHYYFRHVPPENVVFKYFADGRAENLNLFYSVRPYVRKRPRESQLGSGILYDAVIRTRHLTRYFDYQEILRHTKPIHRHVVHIMLDSFQHCLRVTFPTVLDGQTVIKAIERFVDVADNCYDIAPLVRSGDINDKKEEKDPFREYQEQNIPFEQIASEWPHYVVPPSHPYTFLDSSCPCAIFGTL